MGVVTFSFGSLKSKQICIDSGNNSDITGRKKYMQEKEKTVADRSQGMSESGLSVINHSCKVPWVPRVLTLIL